MSSIKTVILALACTVGWQPSLATAGILGPARASQVVTLRTSGAACSVLTGASLIDESHTPAGTIVPYAGPPAKQVLVITSVEFETSGTPGSVLRLVLLRVASGGGSTSAVTSILRTVESSGALSVTVEMGNGVIVQPGTQLCSCASGAAGCNGDAQATIHGYFAPDK